MSAVAEHYSTRNTLRTPINSADLNRAKILKERILASSIFRSHCEKGRNVAKPNSVKEMNETAAYGWDKIVRSVELTGRRVMLTKIRMAYNDQRPFSVDLVGAVRRLSPGV